MAHFPFDASKVAPQTAYEPVPDGWYAMAIQESDRKPTKNQDGSYLEFKTVIIDGQYQGRAVFDRVNIENPNPQAVEIGQRRLSAYCHATGVLQLQQSEQLHGIPFFARVKTITDPTGKYEPSNEIKEIKHISQRSASETQGFGAPQAPQGFPGQGVGFPQAPQGFPQVPNAFPQSFAPPSGFPQQPQGLPQSPPMQPQGFPQNPGAFAPPQIPAQAPQQQFAPPQAPPAQPPVWTPPAPPPQQVPQGWAPPAGPPQAPAQQAPAATAQGGNPPPWVKRG